MDSFFFSSRRRHTRSTRDWSSDVCSSDLLLQPTHCFRDGAFELWIMTGNNILGPVLDVDVWCDAFVLHRPLPITCKEASARCDHRATVDKQWCVGGMDQPTPGSFPNQQANLAALKHVGHQVATRAGHLVNDHYLWSPDSVGGDGEWITIAGDIIHVAIEIAAEYVDDIVRRGAAAIETFVNDDTFLVLL